MMVSGKSGLHCEAHGVGFLESNKGGAIWCHLNQLIKLELLGAHGVAIDCLICAHLFEDVELVDEGVAYFKATEVCADGVHEFPG
jgi:hypothetical protein